MSTVASVRLSDTPAVSSERECDEGSGDGNASVGKADLEFRRHTLNWDMRC